MSDLSLLRTREPSPAPAARLEDFCHAALDLLRVGPEGGPVVSFVAPALARSLAEGGREVIDRLRAEIRGWEAAEPRLRQLADSKLLGFGREAAGLLQRLEQARSQAERVVEVLEALEDGPRRTTSIGAVCPEEEPAAVAQAIACFDRAEACRRSRQLVEAEALYGEALRLDPTLRAARLRRGRTRAFRGFAEEAVADLGDAIRSDPHDAVAYWWRGDALALCDRLVDAVEDYSTALRLRPDLFPARYNRASSLRQLGETARALPEFDALIVLRPDDPSLYLNRGLIYLSRGRIRRALADFRTTLRFKPDSAEARERAREAKRLLSARRARRPPVVAGPSLPPPLPEARSPESGPTPSGPPIPGLPVETPLPPERPAEPAPRSASAAGPLPRSSDSTGSPLAPTVSGGAASPGSGKATVTENSLTVDCPSCRRSSVVRWDKLQRGKVLGCPHCNIRLTAREDGQLVEVIKDGGGRWVERWRIELEKGRRRARRRWLVAGVGAAALAVSAILWGPKVLRSKATAEAELPRDLESRGEMFAKAWLAGDYSRMRRLTDPEQDKLLFAWYRRNKPAAKGAADGTGVEVNVLPGKSPMASLRVRFVTAGSTPIRPPVQLFLVWEARGGVWVFKPAPHLRPKHTDGA